MITHVNLRLQTWAKQLSATLGAIAAAVFLGACTHNEIIRSNIGKSASSCDYSGVSSNTSDECRKYSIEQHVDSKTKDEFLIGVVEFDDQGWFHHAKQMDALMIELENEVKKQDLIVAVFVHGWKHNADYCDANLCCYRAFLQQLVQAEAEYSKLADRADSAKKRRKVVGVYVGWRGLSLKGPDLVRSLSFWDRKNTAATVAQGSVRELFSRLRAFQETHNTPALHTQVVESTSAANSDHRNRLFIVGHSFGGLIVYTSVAQYLINAAVSPRSLENTSKVEGFGDLVVLINPAFEGARYEPLHHVSQTRTYPPKQQPVFISITSTNDSATGRAFPAGRWLSTRFESYSDSPTSIPSSPGLDQTHTSSQEREANLHTAGHLAHYTTHKLQIEQTHEQELAPEDPTCTCPYASAIDGIGRVDLPKEWDGIAKFWQTQALDGKRKPGWKRDFVGGTTLTHINVDKVSTDPRLMPSPPDSPFWLIQTQKPIVNDHNDFWTPMLLNFLRQVYDETLISKDSEPVKQHPTPK